MQTKNQKQKKPVKYTAYVAASIDGRIAKNSLSGVDWTSREDWDFFQNALAKMDAVIVGHNTYIAAKARMSRRNTVVLTSKVNRPKLEGRVVFLNPEKQDLRKFLHAKRYKKIAILGGSKVYDFCLKNKMLDELFVTIEPYIFTAGVPMFSGRKFEKHKFSLQSVKRLNQKGTILIKYKYGN